ncbi:MAG: peptidylprolyl isomerase [Planctomycetaceae bacterium]
MNFRSIFHQIRSKRRFKAGINALHRSVAAAKFEPLEQRTLLTGNVTLQLLGQNAVIRGDRADNAVEILVDNGDVVARGIDGTTINGSTSDFVLAQDVSQFAGSITATFTGGNNVLSVNGVTVGGDVVMNGGRGNDQFVIMGGSVIQRNAVMNGRAGSDVLTVSSATIGRHLILRGGSGKDDIVVDNAEVNGDLRIRGMAGDDDMVVRDSDVGDNLFVLGNHGADVVLVDASNIVKRSALRGGGGADSVVVRGATTFSGLLIMNGGPGSDRLQTSDESTFSRVRTRGFDSNTVDADLLESRITGSSTGALAAAEALVSMFETGLSLSVNNATISESAGASAATITVSRNTSDTQGDLQIALTTSPAGQSKLSLGQTTVIIPAGQTSVTVPVNAIDNSVIDSDTTITVTATATGSGSDTVQITVTNDDISALTLTPLQTQVFEDTGSPTAIGGPQTFDVMVTRVGDTTTAVTVDLSTPDTGRLNLPPTVTIPAGQASATFTVSTIPETTVNADNTVVTIIAGATSYAVGQTQVTLVDTDAPSLLVEFAAPTLSENGTSASGQTTVQVTRNTATTAALTVNLTLTPAGRAQLSSTTLTIPAGSASATVNVVGVEDTVVNGDQQVMVIAMAGGFADGSDSILVTDNDSATLGITITSGSEVAEDAGAGAVTATVSRNVQITATALVVAVDITGDSRLAGPTTVTIPAGQTTATVTFNVVDDLIVNPSGTGPATITVSTSNFTSASATVSIVDDDLATMTLTPTSEDYNEDAGAGAASLTLTRDSSDTAETVTISYSDSLLVSGDTSIQFAVGETQKVVNVDIIDNNSFLDNADVTVTASSPVRASVQATIGIINDDLLTLTTDISSNETVQSVGTLVTKDSVFTITGQTAAGATVQVENTGNALFDDFSTVAAADGSYSFEIPLTHTATNKGQNTIQLRAVVPEEVVDTVAAPIDVHYAVGSLVRFEINQDLNNDSVNDFYDVELLDTDAPLAVANFLTYVEDGSYSDMFVHRSPPNFVIQGGGFKVSNSQISSVSTRPAIMGEFNAAHPNVRGTLSMAHTGNPNTGTSQWFVNVVNNSPGLDNAGHTVFGEVIGSGMTVVDAIATLPIVDVSQLYNGNTNFTTTPFTNNLNTPLTGTVAVTNGSMVVTGTGTTFTSQLQVGDLIQISGQKLFVTAISSDTQLTVDLAASADSSGLSATLIRRPVDEEFIIFSDISQILDAL